MQDKPSCYVETGRHLKILVGFVAWSGGRGAGCPIAALLEKARRQHWIVGEGGALRLRHLACDLTILDAHRKHRTNPSLQVPQSSSVSTSSQHWIV